jgi:hypothetical protein
MNAAAATITAGRQSIPPRKSSKITADVKVRLMLGSEQIASVEAIANRGFGIHRPSRISLRPCDEIIASVWRRRDSFLQEPY